MEREIITTGRTVEEAIESACEQLGIAREDAQWEILDLPKKSMLGLRTTPARVKVTHAQTKVQCAQQYLTEVLAQMGLGHTEITVSEREDGVTFTLEGEGLGVIIGRRGETLDALQYLTGLAANKMDGDYFRVTIDSGHYRQKREKTLTELAERLAKNAVRSGRSSTLEPMNPYERRIIHAAVQTVDGATSSSIGEEPNRRVVISSKTAPKQGYAPRTGAPRSTGNRPPYGDKMPYGDKKPYGDKPAYSGAGARRPRRGGPARGRAHRVPRPGAPAGRAAAGRRRARPA